MKLFFLRHGLTRGNVERLYYGSTDLPLLPEGIAELERKRQAGGYPNPGRFYTSGMRRTEQTLEALYGPVAHGVVPDLRESDFGAFEMLSYEQLKDREDYQAWISGDFEANVAPGGESGIQVTARALAALEPLIAAGEDAVIITHGGVIGGVLNTWFPQELGRYAWTPKPGKGFGVEFCQGVPIGWEIIPKSE